VILALEFLGAVAILVPFALFQRGRWSQHALPYLALNLVGGAILTVVAIVNSQYGFVILQAVWTLVAAAGIVRVMHARP
jgi:hypothetical protein